MNIRAIVPQHGGADILVCHCVCDWRTFLSSRANANPRAGAAS